MILQISKKTVSYLGLLIFLATAILVWSISSLAEAQFTGSLPVQGYAWSDTIGWISLNCETGGPAGSDICSTSDYKVFLEPSGLLTGYGWSDNIGWIKFGGLDTYPAEVKEAANLDFSGDVTSGWIRACAGTVAGDCSSGASRTDGWDGWVSLNGVNGQSPSVTYPYSVTVEPGGYLNGYAWGGEVVGWIAFSGSGFFAKVNPPCGSGSNTCLADHSGYTTENQWCLETEAVIECAEGFVCSDEINQCVANNEPDPGSGELDWSFEVQPKIIRKGETVDVTWSASGAVSCVVRGGSDTWTSLSGEEVKSRPLLGEATFVFSCVPADGGPEVELDRQIIRVLPVISET